MKKYSHLKINRISDCVSSII